MSNGTRNTNWTPDEDESLREALGKRMSAGQAAACLTKIFGREITRSAVLGRAKRADIHLSGKPGHRAPGISPSTREVSAHRSKAEANEPISERKGGVAFSKFAIVPAQKSSPPLDVSIPVSRSVALMDLTPEMCRWPASREDDEWRFCGADKAGGSYCAGHAQIAYRQAPPREHSAETKQKMRVAAIRNGATVFDRARAAG